MDMKTKGPNPADVNNSPECVFNDIKRSCIDCHTRTTPLWRSGPDGPRSLCNACGIRYRKTKRALLGLEKGRAEKRQKRNSHVAGKLGASLKMRHMAAGKEMLLQRSSGEEEQAAVLLMALSSGYVYA